MRWRFAAYGDFTYFPGQSMRVFIFEHHPFDSVFRLGSHGIADELLRRGHEIVWFSHPRTPFHYLIGSVPPFHRTPRPKVQEVTLRAIAPYIGFPVLGSLTWGKRWLNLSGVTRSFLRRRGLDCCDLLWMSNFTMLSMIDLIESPTVVFRFFDHLDKFKRMPQSIFDLIEAYAHKADLCLASSRDVQKELCRKGLDARYLPNGARVNSISVDAAMNNDRERRAIYIGAIDWWFDFDAVAHWASRIPEVKFDVIGPNRAGHRSSLPNLNFIGPVPYEEISKYLLRAQFGLIPFKINSLTLGVHPIKLYDYLAAGCEVISADLPEVPGNQEGVFKYRRPEQAVEVIRRRADHIVDRSNFRRFAEQNSWGARVDSVCELLGIDL